MKKKRPQPEVHPTSLWDSLTLAQRKKLKPQVVDAKLFVAPYVVMKQQIRRAPIGPFGREQSFQERLEEAALLARWRRKHQGVTGGSRSADHPGAACKSKSRKSRRASR